MDACIAPAGKAAVLFDCSGIGRCSILSVKYRKMQGGFCMPERLTWEEIQERYPEPVGWAWRCKICG